MSDSDGSVNTVDKAVGDNKESLVITKFPYIKKSQQKTPLHPKTMMQSSPLHQLKY